MRDIVERLQNEEWPGEIPLNVVDMIDDAADEITRLRGENERLRAANETWANSYHAEYYANVKLRAALQDIIADSFSVYAIQVARAALEGK